MKKYWGRCGLGIGCFIAGYFISHYGIGKKFLKERDESEVLGILGKQKISVKSLPQYLQYEIYEQEEKKYQILSKAFNESILKIYYESLGREYPQSFILEAEKKYPFSQEELKKELSSYNLSSYDENSLVNLKFEISYQKKLENISKYHKDLISHIKANKMYKEYFQRPEKFSFSYDQKRDRPYINKEKSKKYGVMYLDVNDLNSMSLFSWAYALAQQDETFGFEVRFFPRSFSDNLLKINNYLYCVYKFSGNKAFFEYMSDLVSYSQTQDMKQILELKIKEKGFNFEKIQECSLQSDTILALKEDLEEALDLGAKEAPFLWGASGRLAMGLTSKELLLDIMTK